MTNGFNDPVRSYAAKHATQLTGLPKQDLRFAPADNLFDAIRADVAPLGGVEFQPLLRHSEREPPFSEIDEDPNDE
jgi:hypothetical protein